MLYEERSTRAQAEGVRSVPGSAADESRASTAVQAAAVEEAAPLPVLLVTSNQVFADRLRQGLGGSSGIDLIVRNAPRAKTPLARLVAGTGVRLVVLDSVLFEKGVVGLSFPADLSEAWGVGAGALDPARDLIADFITAATEGGVTNTSTKAFRSTSYPGWRRRRRTDAAPCTSIFSSTCRPAASCSRA